MPRRRRSLRALTGPRRAAIVSGSFRGGDHGGGPAAVPASGGTLGGGRRPAPSFVPAARARDGPRRRPRRRAATGPGSGTSSTRRGTGCTSRCSSSRPTHGRCARPSTPCGARSTGTRSPWSSTACSRSRSEVRRAAAEYLGGRPDEVALVRSTTEGLALVYSGLTVAAGTGAADHRPRSLLAPRVRAPRRPPIGRQHAQGRPLRPRGRRRRRTRSWTGSGASCGPPPAPWASPGSTPRPA